MRRVLPFFLIFALSIGRLLSANKSLIDPIDALTRVGQSVTVSGLVVAVFVSKRGNAAINFGDKYPNQTFTGGFRRGTPLASGCLAAAAPRQDRQDHWHDRALYGKPQIKIMSRDQLTSE